MCCSISRGFFFTHPLEIAGRVERRHVVPWRAARAPSWPSCCSRAAPAPTCGVCMDLARRGDAHGPVLRSARQFHQCRAVGPAEHGALGDGVPGRGGMLPRHPSQLYEALTEGLVLFAVLWWLTHRRQALRRPGVIGGHLPGRLRPGAIVLRVLSRAGCRPLVHFRSLHCRHSLFAADDPGRHLVIRAAARRVPAPADVQR